MIAEALHLADEREHVRAQSHGEIAVRVKLARLRMLLRLIENGEERVEPAFVDRDAALIERKRHWLQFPPEFGRYVDAPVHGCTQSVTLSTCHASRQPLLRPAAPAARDKARRWPAPPRS